VSEPPERYWPRRGKRMSKPRVPGEAKDPTSMTEALRAVGADLGIPDTDALATLTRRWTEVVGDAIAAHARLQSLRNGLLTVAVDGPEWATELRYLGAEVRARVTDIVGADLVRDVRVVVAPPS
jgi:predicted nucleic acid-binding Zn ribbon protein